MWSLKIFFTLLVFYVKFFRIILMRIFGKNQLVKINFVEINRLRQGKYCLWSADIQ